MQNLYYMRFFLLFINLLFTTLLFGQIEDPVSWSFQQKDLGNGEFDLVATATIEKGWYIYSQNLEEGGPVATTFEFEPRKSRYSLIGNTKEEGDFIEGFDKLFEMEVKKFKGKTDFTQRVKLAKKGAKITGYLTFMTCNDEKCLPPEDVDFDYVLKVGKSKTSLGASSTPKASSNTTANSTIKKNEQKTVVKSEPKPKKVAQLSTKSNNVNDGGLAIASAEKNQGILDPVNWSMRSVKTAENSFDLFFNATIEDGWYIYSQEVEEGGPEPTAIEFTENKNVKFLLAKSIETSKHTKEGFDKLFDMDIKKFAKAVEYKMPIKVNGIKEKLSGYLVFMTCDDEKCLPPEEIEFEFDLSKEQTIDLGVIPVGDLPTNLGKDSKYVIENVDVNNPINDCGTEEEQQGGKGIWGIFILGFLGGVVALLTPCVFPMIPLTVSYFTKGSDNRKKGVFNALLYGLFIFLIYIIFSLPFHIFDSVAPDIFNQISTNEYLNLAFFVIFVVFAISFFGYFEITLPSSIANKADSASNLGGLIGIFFMALTLALVSFSCTGPILGSLLAGALSSDGGAMQLTAGMGGFGLALGVPFAIFALFPGMLSSLPKSGGWLNTVKVVLGFVELALAVKFLSNADLVKEWGILPREIFFGLWILIAAGLAAYLFGLIKFPHDSPIKKLSFPRIGLGVLTVAFLIYLLPGLTNSKYANRQLLSGFPPPLFYSLYEKQSNCPLDLNCYKDYEKGLAYAKKVNKPILLDFTGWACVNCRKMEENVWNQPEIFEKLNEDFVLISLYVDDKKELPEDKVHDFVSSTGRKQKIDKKGEVWATMQTETFVNNSQPYYAVLSPDELLLNSPVGYKPDITEYSSFLECGLDAFDQLEKMLPNERAKLKQKFATVMQ